MTKKELKELIKEVISEETQSVDPEEILGKILELTISDTSDPLLILMKIRALAKNYFDKVGYKVNEAGGYEDGIKDAKDRMKYVALRKMEKDHLAKSKITKDIKKQHHLDMADKYLQQALDIAKKHNVVD
jgi:hypothetical protein|tara:strand:+ start:132 stop:521 length:390 start_codon:yes stop_codon:yes gene_type:complete